MLRAIGADETLDERLAQEAFTCIEPGMRRLVDAGLRPADRLNMDSAWSLQERLLHIAGRHA